jgi:hypothetical protein
LSKKSSVGSAGECVMFNVPGIANLINDYIDHSLMATYDDISLNRIPLTLQPGEKEHILVVQDETIFHTNEYHQHMWVKGDQQLIQKKGGECMIHVSDFISETIGQLKLSEEQISNQHKLLAEKWLAKFKAQAIIYLGKGFDAW